MTPGIIIHIILALFVGWVTQRLMGYTEINFFTTLVVGLIGSWGGSALARMWHLPYAFPDDTIQRWAGVSIPYSIAGCVALIIAMNLIARPGKNGDTTN